MQHFRELRAWQRAHAFLKEIYALVREFPSNEQYVLSQQLRRAAHSVTSNIAEGSKRAHAIDYARFLNYAQGSISEIESQLIAAQDLGFGNPTRIAKLLFDADEIGKMLHRLRETVLANAAEEQFPPER